VKHLYYVQDRLNAISSSVFAFPLASGFLIGWFAAHFLSGGKFDSDLGLGNLLLNGVGLLLMFASCAISARAEKALHERADKLHEHIESAVA
jgi:hypothetical protein